MNPCKPPQTAIDSSDWHLSAGWSVALNSVVRVRTKGVPWPVYSYFHRFVTDADAIAMSCLWKWHRRTCLTLWAWALYGCSMIALSLSSCSLFRSGDVPDHNTFSPSAIAATSNMFWCWYCAQNADGLIRSADYPPPQASPRASTALGSMLHFHYCFPGVCAIEDEPERVAHL